MFKQLLLVSATLISMTACGAKTREVSLPQAMALQEVIEHLPEEARVVGVTVEFEPGRTGDLLLSSPTRSAQEIARQAGEAQKKTHDALRRMLSAGGASESPELNELWLLEQAEIKKLNELDAHLPTPQTMRITQVFLKGPPESIAKFQEWAQSEAIQDNPADKGF